MPSRKKSTTTYKIEANCRSLMLAHVNVAGIGEQMSNDMQACWPIRANESITHTWPQTMRTLWVMHVSTWTWVCQYRSMAHLKAAEVGRGIREVSTPAIIGIARAHSSSLARALVEHAHHHDWARVSPHSSPMKARVLHLQCSLAWSVLCAPRSMAPAGPAESSEHPPRHLTSVSPRDHWHRPI
eukprot:scaffold53388_cov30-Tisochrysis_lutea.AAC.3